MPIKGIHIPFIDPDLGCQCQQIVTLNSFCREYQRQLLAVSSIIDDPRNEGWQAPLKAELTHREVPLSLVQILPKPFRSCI